jgi:AcrR family transcriptional regulator
MTRIATVERPYHSQLREQQAQGTRERILEATLRLMADGLACLSIPAVAREAGVSVPTIYRHFGTKAALLSALYPYFARRTGLDAVPDPTSLDDLRGGIRAYFDRLDALKDLARAAYASPIADDVRHATMDSRVQRIRRVADSVRPRLPKVDRDRITRLLVVLTSSSALRMWRDHLGASVEDAADDIDWVVRAAITAAGSKGMSR